MSNLRFWTVVGLVIGAVGAFQGFDGALLTFGLGVVGYLVGTVIEQGIDLREGLRQDRDL